MTELSKDIEWIKRVSMGKVPGARIFGKFAEQPNLTNGVQSEIWDYGPTEPTYNYSAGHPNSVDAVADITHFSSSNAGDTQDWIVLGLDINGFEVEQEITMVGQTKTALGTALWRVYRVMNISSTDNVGNIYVYTDTAITAGVPNDTTQVKAHVAAGNNITRMGMFTIPKGETGFLVSIDTSVTKKGAFVDWENSLRLPNGVFFSPNIFALASTGSSKDNSQILAFERTDELTDLRTLVTSDTTGAGATIVSIWVYLDNTIFNL